MLAIFRFKVPVNDKVFPQQYLKKSDGKKCHTVSASMDTGLKKTLSPGTFIRIKRSHRVISFEIVIAPANVTCLFKFGVVCFESIRGSLGPRQPRFLPGICSKMQAKN